MNLKKTISYALVVLLFSFLLWKIIHDFDQIKSVQWKFQPKNLGLLLLVLLPGPFINALSWHLMTKALGENIAFIDNVKIWTYSNATRFLPGSIWQYAGRVYMLSQKGVNKTFTTTAILVEAILNLVIGSTLSLLVVKFWPLAIPPVGQKILLLLLLFTLLAIVFLSRNRVSLLQKVIKETFEIRLKWLPIVLLSVFTQFVLAGLSLFFVSVDIANLGNNSAVFFIGIYAASWVIGYLAFLAPSGLGVREASIAGLLTFYVPLVIGGLIAILFRLALTVSEAITVLIVFLLAKKRIP